MERNMEDNLIEEANKIWPAGVPWTARDPDYDFRARAQHVDPAPKDPYGPEERPLFGASPGDMTPLEAVFLGKVIGIGIGTLGNILDEVGDGPKLRKKKSRKKKICKKKSRKKKGARRIR